MRKTILVAAVPVCWSLPALIAPAGGTATVGSIMNLSNNFMGALAPAVTGFLVRGAGSFEVPVVPAGCVLLAGIASFVPLLGRIETLPEPA